jgi:hypothetical protein
MQIGSMPRRRGDATPFSLNKRCGRLRKTAGKLKSRQNGRMGNPTTSQPT